MPWKIPPSKPELKELQKSGTIARDIFDFFLGQKHPQLAIIRLADHARVTVVVDVDVFLDLADKMSEDVFSDVPWVQHTSIGSWS